jgi:hypothetical protein
LRQSVADFPGEIRGSLNQDASKPLAVVEVRRSFRGMPPGTVPVTCCTNRYRCAFRAPIRFKTARLSAVIWDADLLATLEFPGSRARQQNQTE